MNSERIMTVIAEAIENQLRDNDPKETKETLDRLMEKRLSESEALARITMVLTEEMFEVFKFNKEFNTLRYIMKLNELE